MGVKRTKHDAVFSDLIRERANYTCEYSGVYIPEGERQACHCAHIHGRKNQSTRYDPDNAVCLSAKWHYYFTDHPTEFTRWLQDYLGEKHLDILRDKAMGIKKWTKAEKEEMYKHYKNELKIMRQKRDNGQTGRIEFVCWD